MPSRSARRPWRVALAMALLAVLIGGLVATGTGGSQWLVIGVVAVALYFAAEIVAILTTLVRQAARDRRVRQGGSRAVT